MDCAAIHQRTLECAQKFQRVEAELIECLQLVKLNSVHLKLGYSSLHVYAVTALSFSDDQAYQFTRVALKSIEIPEIKRAISSGVLNVSKARRVLSVINSDNQAEWISKAATLSQKQLEREIVRVHPSEIVRDRVKALTPEFSEFKCSIPVEVEALIKRVQDLESQRLGRAVNLSHTLKVGLDAYLQKNDPLILAKRQLEKGKFVLGAKPDLTIRESKPGVSSRRKKEIGDGSPGSALRQSETVHKSAVDSGASTSIQPSAAVLRAVTVRDDSRCTHRDVLGNRCESRRWIEVHHLRPQSLGGLHTAQNLVTLCSAHHRFLHRQGIIRTPPIPAPTRG